jgi:hypothetical protein
MGFYRRILPDVKVMEKIKESFPDDREFLKHIYGKSDALEGSSESFEFIRAIENKIREEKINNK